MDLMVARSVGDGAGGGGGGGGRGGHTTCMYGEQMACG